MANTMGVKSFITAAKHLPSWCSVLIRGGHGIGKSEIVAQLAKHFRDTPEVSECEVVNNDVGKYPIIDMRLGQIDVGDIVGLPFKENGITRFMPPWWVKLACEQPCHLFLDEINRGTTEVMQAAFQLVLDRKIQDNKLHPLTRVYAAVNVGSMYGVNEMDPALLDRFWTIDLVPTHEEFLQWASSNEEMLPVIIDFLRNHPKMIDPAPDGQIGEIDASRRSWHRLSKTYIHAGLVDEIGTSQLAYQLALGFVGTEATIQFNNFAKNYDAQVSAEDIMNKMIKKVFHTNTQIIGTDDDTNKYDEQLVNKLKSMNVDKFNSTNEKIIVYLLKNCYGKDNKEITDKQGTALAKYMSLMPAEIRMAFWTLLVDKEKFKHHKIDVDQAPDQQFSSKIHKWCAHHIMASFGVKLQHQEIASDNVLKQKASRKKKM